MMAVFGDLPNEIVCEVLEVVLPEDLESFAQTNRRVFLVSKPFLKEHRKLIRLYTTFSSYPPPGQERHTEARDGFSVGPVPNLFRDVLSKPRISHYIRKVKLAAPLKMEYAVICKNSINHKNFAKARASYKKQFGLINAAVAQSDVPEIRDKYRLAKDKGLEACYDGEYLLIAILLPLLSNLNSLSVEWNASQDSYVSDMIRYGALVGFPWLVNLATVRLEELRDGRGKLCLSDLRLFNSLPALKSLTAFNIWDDMGLLGTADKHLRRQDSHTTELKLLNCYVSSRSLQDYLKSFRNLQNFTVEHDRSPFIYNGDAFEPRWIRKALLVSARTTLQTLTLLGLSRAPVDSMSSDHFMGSLQAFEALRDIHTEWRFLIPRVCYFETHLSRVLPASLHRLQLREHRIPSDLVAAEYRAFFRGIRSAKDEICLCLEDVGVKNSDEGYEWGESWSSGEQDIIGFQTLRVSE